MTRSLFRVAPLAAAAMLTLCGAAQASSHREAPFIATSPKVDATDFYMFNSYETGRSDYVTLLANYQPLQDSYGGPNYFKMDPNGLYEIHIDNVGDGKEHLTFQFRFKNTLANGGAGIAIPVGDKTVAIPLTQAGQVTDVGAATLNVSEGYTVTIVRGDRRTGKAELVSLASDPNKTTFVKPVDNIGFKTLPDYAGYAAKHIYSIAIPGCATPGKVFAGQRKDPFAVNLGTIFDLVNAPVAVITDPTLIGALPSTIDDKNVTTLALEVPKSCLIDATSKDPVIGGWTSASLRQTRVLDPSPKSGLQTSEKAGGAWVQVSRLGNPLVNEVVIGLPDKDKFNASKPKDDLQFATYVTNPTLPRLLEIALDADPAFGGTAAGKIAPKNFPRTDLLTVFLNGITGVNRPKGAVVAAEMMRLNTAIAAVPLAKQNRLGVAGEVLKVGGAGNLANAVDLAGYPNGRRPNDDVVDISLVAVAGGLCVINSAAQIGAITAASNDNVLGLNSFVIPGSPATTLTSDCKFANVPLGATSAKLHDAVDQAKAPLLAGFPYLFTPIGGTTK